MRDPVILTWNVTNWITIFLMALIGFVVASFGYQFYKNKVSSTSAG